MGSPLLNGRSFTYFALINYNESGDDPTFITLSPQSSPLIMALIRKKMLALFLLLFFSGHGFFTPVNPS